QGDPVTEVLAEVGKFRRARRWRLGLAAGLAVAAATASASALVGRPQGRAAPPTQPCLLTAEIRLRAPLPEGLPPAARLTVSTAKGRDSYPLNTLGPVPLDAVVKREETWSIDVEDLPNVSFHEGRVKGCPGDEREIKGDDGAVLILRPR